MRQRPLWATIWTACSVWVPVRRLRRCLARLQYLAQWPRRLGRRQRRRRAALALRHRPGAGHQQPKRFLYLPLVPALPAHRVRIAPPGI